MDNFGKEKTMNKEKKTYQTPEAEVILFGEDIITCSGVTSNDIYNTEIIPDDMPGLY